ncbi:transcriptional regulator, SARP family protein [Pelomyxa schiedti]|nr:transcriptional regulator, SARP family protein [Pelomyxa schiedti]
MQADPMQPSSTRYYTLDSKIPFEEDSEHEFKSLTNVTEVTGFISTIAVRYLNAFVNASGGTIFFGVADDGTISGICLQRSFRDDLRLKLDGLISNFRPEIDPEMWSVSFIPIKTSEGILLEDVFVVEVKVAKGRAPIYMTNDQTRSARAYVRRQGSISEMSPSMIDERKFMGRPALNYSITQRSNHLIGRDYELNLISSFITNSLPDSPLVVLLFGLPLVGKTSIMQHVARQFSPKFADVYVQMNLGSTTVRDAMKGAIRTLSSVGTLPENESELCGMYQSCFRGKSAIVLIEDVGGCEQVLQLIPKYSSPCLVLLTSQQHIPLDSVIESPCLKLRIGALLPSDAILLLKSLCPQVPLSQDQAEYIVQLCCLMPVPIRKAASQLNTSANISPEMLINKLNTMEQHSELLRPYFLEAASRDLIEKWAIPLTVFKGTFDITAAMAVLQQEDCTETRNILYKLIDYSLIECDLATNRFYQSDLVCSWLLKKAEAESVNMACFVERFIKFFIALLEKAAAASPLNADLSPALCLEENNIETAYQYSTTLHLPQESVIVGHMSNPEILSLFHTHTQFKWRHMLNLPKEVGEEVSLRKRARSKTPRSQTPPRSKTPPRRSQTPPPRPRSKTPNKEPSPPNDSIPATQNSPAPSPPVPPNDSTQPPDLPLTSGTTAPAATSTPVQTPAVSPHSSETLPTPHTSPRLSCAATNSSVTSLAENILSLCSLSAPPLVSSTVVSTSITAATTTCSSSSASQVLPPSASSPTVPKRIKSPVTPPLIPHSAPTTHAPHLNLLDLTTSADSASSGDENHIAHKPGVPCKCDIPPHGKIPTDTMFLPAQANLNKILQLSLLGQTQQTKV